jgi:Ulp1 family protease
MTNIDEDSNLKVPYYIEINGITIFSSSVNCLSPQSWLNDSIVDLTVSIVLTNLEADLASAKLKVHCFSTLIWSVILRNFNNPDEEESFKKYPDISNMDFVFFPIVHFNHFSCVVVDNMKDLTNDNDLCDLCIYHMDSLVGIHDQEHSIDVIKHFLLRKYGIDEQKRRKLLMLAFQNYCQHLSR